MWKEWNVFPWCAFVLHGCGHVVGREQVSLMCKDITWWWPCEWGRGGFFVVKWYDTWSWPCGIEERVSFWWIFYIYIYMINLYIHFVIFLTHPICLCLTMIVYAVHVSIWCCRWSWWGLAAEWGKSLGVLYYFVLKYFVNCDERLYYYV